MGKSIVTLSVEAHSESSVSILVGGGLYPYRARLDEYEVPEAKHDSDKENNRFYRILRVDAKDDVSKKRALDMFATVFKNLAMKLIVQEPAPPASAAENFMDQLRELPNMH